MILPALLLVIFLFLQTAAADSVFASPLFGNCLGSVPFDDGNATEIPNVLRLRSLSICHGDAIDGIQLLYILKDNSTFIGPPHGKINKDCPNNSKMRTIVFKENERLVHIEGTMHNTWQYISQLKLFNSIGGGPPKRRGGPFGSWQW